MRSVSLLLEVVGEAIAWMYPQHKLGGRKHVSLTNDHTLPPEYLASLKGRTQYFTSVLCIMALSFYLVVTNVVEVYFAEQTALHVFYEMLVITALYLAVRYLLPHYARWYDLRACGYIQEDWLTIGWPTDLDKPRGERKFGPLNSPEKRLESFYNEIVFGDWITGEHLTSGAAMVIGGFFLGSGAWFRHGICSHTAYCFGEIVVDYVKGFAKHWTDDKSWTEFLLNIGPMFLWDKKNKRPSVQVIHHTPTLLVFIPLSLYFYEDPLFQLSCGILAANPMHYFEHCAWPQRFATLKYKDGDAKYDPKRRGARELWVLWKAFNTIFLILWRGLLFQLPLGWYLLQRLLAYDFSLCTLALTVAYGFMSWFNIFLLCKDWCWNPMVKRFAELRGARANFEESSGGRCHLVIHPLRLRRHLAASIRERVKELQSYPPLDRLDVLSGDADALLPHLHSTQERTSAGRSSFAVCG